MYDAENEGRTNQIQLLGSYWLHRDCIDQRTVENDNKAPSGVTFRAIKRLGTGSNSSVERAAEFDHVPRFAELDSKYPPTNACIRNNHWGAMKSGVSHVVAIRSLLLHHPMTFIPPGGHAFPFCKDMSREIGDVL